MTVVKREPLLCDLTATKKALRLVKGNGKEPDKWVEDKDELAKLPDLPDPFVPVRGPYGMVARHAVRLNDIQQKSGFMKYIFSPEPVTTAAA